MKLIVIETLLVAGFLTATPLSQAFWQPDLVPEYNEMPELPIQSGDLVVRKGRSFLSHQLALRNRTEMLWSHCGMAEVTESGVFVWHIIGDARPNLRRERLKYFLHPEITKAMAIYRYQLDASTIHRCMHRLRALQAKDIQFDFNFAANNDEYYCSELIADVMNWSTDAAIDLASLSCDSQTFITIDDLYLKQARLVFDWNFDCD